MPFPTPEGPDIMMGRRSVGTAWQEGVSFCCIEMERRGGGWVRVLDGWRGIELDWIWRWEMRGRGVYLVPLCICE